MNKTMLFGMIMLWTVSIHAQSWPTIGGNNQKNGRSEITGPQSLTQFWSVTSPNTTLWGNSVFTFGDMFVQSRVVFTPSYTSKVELRNLQTGGLIWEQQVDPAAILYAVGFTEDAVYATDYGSGMLYALAIGDGSVKWSVNTTMFPGNTGLVYACNGDPIEFGKRMNKETGEIVWSNDYPIPVGPDGGYVVFDKTYYHWTGYINTDKALIAIDAETGLTRYASAALPGDGDQENDLVAGPDGTIYITRDGGALYAFKDDGAGFSELWSRFPGPLVKAVGWDGTIYAASSGDHQLIRLDPESGATLDSAQVTVNVLYGYVSVGADSTVYVATAEIDGKYFALSADLQTVKWEVSVPYNYYSAPALAKGGVLITVGAGTSITAYKTLQDLKPVADFSASVRELGTGESVDFYDLSSFTPTSWEWMFPGSNILVSNEEHPVGIVYDTAGMYEVTLVASNAHGTDSLVRQCYMNVVSSSGVLSDNPVVPATVDLLQNYPNPFNGTTAISYQLSAISHVSLTVYDMLGRKVIELVNGVENAGLHDVSWNADGLASGIYVYRIRTGSFVASGKMALLR